MERGGKAIICYIVLHGFASVLMRAGTSELLGGKLKKNTVFGKLRLYTYLCEFHK